MLSLRNKNHEIRNCWIRYPELKKNRTDQSEKKDFKPFFKEKNNYQQPFRPKYDNQQNHFQKRDNN